MARIYVVEPGPTGGPGVFGSRLVVAILRESGHQVTALRMRDTPEGAQIDMFSPGPRSEQIDARTLPRPDAWFISCLYVRQWVYLGALFARIGLAPLAADRRDSDPLVAFGGAVAITPEPMAPFADVIALGDGEITASLLASLAPSGRIRAMADVRGERGFYAPLSDSPPVPFRRVTAPDIRARVVTPGEGGSGQTPTVEVARGCRGKCAFCAIGWAGGAYREIPIEQVKTAISGHKRVNTFAPDYASISAAQALDEYMATQGIINTNHDSRVDATLRRGVPHRDYAFGIEGVSERIRRGIGKPIPHDDIVRLMAALDVPGHRQTWYVVHGLPGETSADRAEFMALLADVQRVYHRPLSISCIPFQSIPHTPLQWADNRFNSDARTWVQELRAYLRETQAERQHIWMASEPKGRELHEHDAWLQRSGREIAAYLLGAHESHVQSGRWRDRAPTDPHRVLGPIDPGDVTPWSHVDVGQRPGASRAAWTAYQRRVIRCEGPGRPSLRPGPA